jgi:AcrR family transcriptional regulator
MSAPGEPAKDPAGRILDAAADLFAEHGVNAVGMGAIARAAGCSRATLYRYFADRHDLHLAFVHREARRIGALVAAETAQLRRSDRLAASLLAAVRHVRQAPTLLAWFGAADAGTTARLAQSDEVVEALGLSAVSDPDDAKWLVRVIVSLLMVPGRDDADERAMVERYVVPALVRPPR